MERRTEQLLGLIKEYDKMKKVHLSCYELLSTLRDELRASKYGLKDLVNFIYVMREVSKLADDLRKETDGIGHMFENATCALWIALDDSQPIRAPLATGSPDLKLGVRVPNQTHEPERFQALMDFFGVPAKALSMRAVKPYWPGICEQVSILTEEGHALPPGINPDDTYPTYKVRVKMIKNLDELVRSIDDIDKKFQKDAKKRETTLMKALKTKITEKLKEARGKETEAYDELLTTRK